MFLKFSKAHWLKLYRDRLPDERKREMQFTRWLRNRAVTASEMAAHAATGTAERVSGRHIVTVEDTTELVLGASFADR